MKQWNRQPYARIRSAGADAPYQEIRVINPSRGLNLLIADILSNDKEATQGSKNIEYVEGGAARKRMGYVAVGTGLGVPPKGLSYYMSEAANYPITSDAGVLKKYQSGTWSTLAGAITLDTTANITMTPLWNKTYAWDRTNGGVVFDGATVTRPGTMPKAQASVIYKGYHVAFGVPGQPFRLYFAPPREPSRFTYDPVHTTASLDDIDLVNATEVPGATVFTGDVSPRAIDVNKNDGQTVTGLGFFQDSLIVFKENSIYQLYFNSSNGFVVERITSSYGCVSHGSIASVENDTYFLTEKGIYVLGNEPNFYAAIRTNELSSRIKTLLQRINPLQYARCRAFYTDDRYFLSVPLDANTECNALIVYDRRFYSWAYWDNIAANDLVTFKDKDGDGATHFYFTEYGSATMCEFTPGVYNDKGAPIHAVFITRAFEGKAVDREKYWYELRPIFRLTTGEVQLSYITENGSEGRPVSLPPAISGGLGVDMLGSLTFGTSQHDTYTDVDMGIASTGDTSSSETDSTHSVFNIGVNISSRTLKVKFENEGLNETFTLLGWILLYQERDAQRFDGNYTIR